MTHTHHAEGQGRYDPASRAADRARLAAVLRAMPIAAALAIVVLFALGMPAHAASTQACPGSMLPHITPAQWLLIAAGVFAAIAVGVTLMTSRAWKEADQALENALRMQPLDAALHQANNELAQRPHPRLRAISTPADPWLGQGHNHRGG